MEQRLSPRLTAIVDALPLRPGLRVLEIGCGSGAAARYAAERIGTGHVLAIDRSAKAVRQAEAGSANLISAGCLSFRQAAIEDFELAPGEEPFDLAFAVRVGALDGRHPEAGVRAKALLKVAVHPSARLFLDGGDPLRDVRIR